MSDRGYDLQDLRGGDGHVLPFCLFCRVYDHDRDCVRGYGHVRDRENAHDHAYESVYGRACVHAYGRDHVCECVDDRELDQQHPFARRDGGDDGLHDRDGGGEVRH